VDNIPFYILNVIILKKDFWQRRLNNETKTMLKSDVSISNIALYSAHDSLGREQNDYWR
jgi:hypothetical protein